jgi:DNA mismatch repair protein MutL
MKRINILSQDTANKIAAGEVVERASSAVKELVENSIDAGSENITIEVEESGSKLIRISDDGSGIHPEDIEKAFMPHATSKIYNIEDIFSINSFGFRGEALSSVASVAKVLIKTRTADFDFGKEMYVEGGEIKYIKDVGCNIGTTIEVRDLFFNVPARQKFLKSPQRENGLISDLVLRLALGNYKVAFKLYSNGKEVLTSYRNENPRDTIRTLYGKQVYDNILPFETHSDIISIHGYVGNSEISRGSRNRQSIYVNNRLIKSSTITAAVENAFKSFITVNKFPFFVVYIDIFPEYIDPNVHPTKAEIKFFDEKSLFKLVFDGVHLALRESLKDSFRIDEENDNLDIVSKEKEFEGISVVQMPIDFRGNMVKEVADDEASILTLEKNISSITSRDNYNTYSYKDSYNNKSNDVNTVSSSYKPVNDEKEAVKNLTLDNTSIISDLDEPKLPIIKIIGQFNNSYIIGEYNKELYLIDQHAAHEKVLFEKYKKSITALEVISQVLLTPLIIELGFEDYSYYEENKEIFKKCGFLIEDFGDNSVAIREVPMFLGKPDVKNLFYDIIENIKALGSATASELKYDKIASLACKAAVKANNKLSELEMEALINELRYIDEPFTCPHGRPTIIKFSLYELEKRFKRIQ